MFGIRRLALTTMAAATMLGALAPAALAGQMTDLDRAEAAGWGCGATVGLPYGHCISPGTVKQWPSGVLVSGGTFQLRVFDGDGNFVTAEIATLKPSADGRACPHDAGATDGTYWAFVPGFLWVCHHKLD